VRNLRFKQFLRERNQFSKTGEETLLSVSEYYGVKPRAEAFKSEEHESRAATLEGYRIVKIDDLVMNYMLAWKGAYGVSNHDGIVSPAYSVFKVDQKVVDVRYLHHRVRSDDMKAYFRSRSKGIIESRLRLYPDAMLSSYVEIPDLSTQRQIADFLDRETARIDLLIEKKKRFVELLNEKRFSEISSLLTGELFRQTPQQNCSIPWLESIPSDWVESRLKNACIQIIDCKNRTPDAVDDGNYFVVRTTCVRNGKFNIEGGYYTDADSYREWTQRGKPEAGDVIFTREAPVGEACLAPQGINFCLGQRTMIYRPDPRKILPEYIVATIYSSIGKSYIGEKGKGSTVGHLRVPEVHNFPCLLPPLETQKIVLAELSRRTGHFEELEMATYTSIDRLKEYRSALITAAVTGQIDVQTYAKSGTSDRRLDAIQEEMGA